MQTTRATVRDINVYYEATGPFAVNKERAEAVFDVAASIVARYTGPLAISVRGARVPDRNPISARHIRLPGAHIALLTARATETLRELGGDCYREQIGGLITTSTIVTTLPPRGGSLTDTPTIAVSVHEIGHSFGLKHCETEPPCIMQARLRTPLTQLAVPADPFCNNCTGDLELAGYSSLAARLGSTKA